MWLDRHRTPEQVSSRRRETADRKYSVHQRAEFLRRRWRQPSATPAFVVPRSQEQRRRSRDGCRSSTPGTCRGLLPTSAVSCSPMRRPISRCRCPRREDRARRVCRPARDAPSDRCAGVPAQALRGLADLPRRASARQRCWRHRARRRACRFVRRPRPCRCPASSRPAEEATQGFR